MFNGSEFGLPRGTGEYFMGQNAQQQAKQSNNLTADQIQRLVQKENQFSLNITETEKLRAICNHRSADGMSDTLVEDPSTGMIRCQICGYSFAPVSDTTSLEEIKDSVDRVVDVLQTIKMMYKNMPADSASEYFPIIPLLEKIPKLFEFAIKDYAKFENPNVYGYSSRNMGTMQLFNMIAGAMGNTNQQFNNGFVPGQQPQMAPGANPVFNNMSNGFGTMGAGMNSPQNGYQAQTNDYRFVPGQQTAESSDKKDETVTVQQTFQP